MDTAALLQRTGLNLTAGQVVLAMGGNFGDCAAYRGRVIAVPEAGGKPRIFTVDAAAGQSQGAVWMGGAAPAVDSAGHVWVSVGNGSVHSSSERYDYSDSLLELSPTMRLLQYFAPRSWASDNAQDLDMSTGPVLLPSGQVLLAGKSRIAYLLNGAHLGGIGGAQASLGSVCDSDIDGGAAVVGMTVYLPCCGRHRRGPGDQFPARPAPGVAVGHRRRSPDRSRRTDLDHRAERDAVRPQPGHRPGAAAGPDRRGGQPLPHPGRGRRPAAGARGHERGRVPHLRFPCRYAHSAPQRPDHRPDGPAGQSSHSHRAVAACRPARSRASWPAAWC